MLSDYTISNIQNISSFQRKEDRKRTEKEESLSTFNAVHYKYKEIIIWYILHTQNCQKHCISTRRPPGTDVWDNAPENTPSDDLPMNKRTYPISEMGAPQYGRYLQDWKRRNKTKWVSLVYIQIEVWRNFLGCTRSALVLILAFLIQVCSLIYV